MLPISFGGIASGLDTNAIINGLVGIERQAVQRIEFKRQETQNAVSAFSNLRSRLGSLQDIVGSMSDVRTFGRITAESADESILTATADGLADAGAFEVRVDRLAEADKVMSDRVSDKDRTGLLRNGRLELTIGGELTRIDVSSSMTLEDLKEAINESGADVNAGIVNDGNGFRLTIAGKKTGAANRVTISERNGFTLGLRRSSNRISTAQDAQITLDRRLTITSETNTLKDTIEGVTLNLLRTSSGQHIGVNVARDPGSQANAIEELVGSFNEVTGFINSQIRPAQIGQRALLHNDSTMRGVRDRLRGVLNTVVSNGSDFNTATRIGLEMTSTGQLKLDRDKLEAALEEDFDGVMALFTKDGEGLADRFDAAIDTMIEDNGLIENRTEGLGSRVRDLNRRIDSQNRRVDSYEARLRGQFLAMEKLISQLNDQSSFLQSRIGLG